jgi:hypothetical protein
LTEIADRAVDLASASLRDVENYIGPRLRGFMEVGLALIAVRERRLYFQAGFDSFEAYCEKRWDLGRSHAYRMCDAAQVHHALAAGSTGSPPGENVESEWQARELAPLLGKPDELRAVWQETVERTQGAVTAAAIRQVRRQHEQQQRQPSPARPAPPAPSPRPSPVQVIPVDARRVFQIVTQAAEEVRALGGADVFRGEMSADVRTAWTEELVAAAKFVMQLAEACAGPA